MNEKIKEFIKEKWTGLTLLVFILIFFGTILLSGNTIAYKLQNFWGEKLISDYKIINEFPKSELTCDYYDIENQFNRVFDVYSIDKVANRCKSLGGIWVQQHSFIRCEYKGKFYLNCDSQFIKDAKKLCTALKANFVCDNDQGEFSCSC